MKIRFHFTVLMTIVASSTPALSESGILPAELARLSTLEKRLSDELAVDPKNATLYSSRGRIRFEMEDLPRALEDFNQAIALSPRDPLLYHRRCYTLKGMGNLTAAELDCRKATELDPYYDNAHITLGDLRGLLGDYEGQLAEYQKAIDVNPLNMLPHINRIHANLAHGDIQGAISSCGSGEAVLSMFDAAKVALDALPLSQQQNLHASLPVSQHPEYFFTNCATARTRANQPAEAIALAEKALEIDPAFDKAYVSLSDSYQLLGNKQEERSALDKGLEANPLNLDLLAHRGRLEYEQGDAESARRDFEKAVEVDPKNTSALWMLATILASLQQSDKALEQFDKAVALQKSDANLLIARGMTNLKVGKVEEAAKDFSAALDINPDSKQGLELHAEASSRLGRFREARDDMEKLNTLHPKQKWVLCRLGILDLQVGQIEKSYERAGELTELEPQGTCSIWIKALANCFQQKYAQALRELDATAQLTSREPSIQRLRAFIHLRMGNFAAAARAFEAFAALVPETKEKAWGDARCGLFLSKPHGEIEFSTKECLNPVAAFHLVKNLTQYRPF